MIDLWPYAMIAKKSKFIAHYCFIAGKNDLEEKNFDELYERACAEADKLLLNVGDTR